MEVKKINLKSGLTDIFQQLPREKLDEIAKSVSERIEKEFNLYKKNLSEIPFGEDILGAIFEYAEKDAGHDFDSPLAFEFCESDKQIILQRVSNKCNCSLEVLENSWNRLMTEHLYGDGKTAQIFDMRDTNITSADYRYGGWV